jgi:hypothetical protein
MCGELQTINESHNGLHKSTLLELNLGDEENHQESQDGWWHA